MDAPIPQQLLEILNRVDRPGTFCTSGVLPPALPGLEVAGVGSIALPLESQQALALTKRAHQAPYGKGTKTLVDTNVRRVWEIDARQVVLANPQWDDVVKQAVQTAQRELGLEKQRLRAHLYKLLLYEKGSFFLAHRDGEKLARMVATLVIALPSAHSGGELIVRHEGREAIVNFSPGSRFQTQFAAFYADCEHEIRPVRRGFRVALVYNLTLEKSKRRLTAPTSAGPIALVADVLSQWSRQGHPKSGLTTGSPPSKLAVLLDHQYTEVGLTRDALKGIDRAKADVLFAAAAKAGFDAFLALVTYWESGAGSPSDDGGYGYHRRGWDNEYEEDSSDGGDGEYVMEEVFDSGLSAGHFSDAHGRPLAFGEIHLDDGEIVSKEPIGDREPDKEDFEGYTGNAGMTLERWYHRAAIVMWPSESRFGVLCEESVQAAVGGLEQMMREWRAAAKNEKDSLRHSCLDFASRIIAHWPEQEFCSGYGQRASFPFDAENDGDEFEDVDEFDLDGEDGEPDSADRDSESVEGRGVNVPAHEFLPLLAELGDVELIAEWIRHVLGRDASIDPGKTLGDLCAQCGWATFQDDLRLLFAETCNETLERHARLLVDFSLPKDKNPQRLRLCSDLARQLVSAIEDWEPKAPKRDWQARIVNLRELLALLMQALLTLEEPDLLVRLIAYILARPKAFDPTTVQVPALLALKPWLKRAVKHPTRALHRWLDTLVKELRSRKANPPEKPRDWRRASDTGCKCGDCKDLSRFLKDPKAATLRLPLAKDRRRHLHTVIAGMKLDTTHATERRGSPYTLVCKKTRASYERALEAYRTDLDQLSKMEALLDWHEGLKKDAVGAG